MYLLLAFLVTTLLEGSVISVGSTWRTVVPVTVSTGVLFVVHSDVP